jgi:hypothetical protein
MPPGNEEGRPTEVSTWLVIPYFPKDFGRAGVERPIDPSKAVYYLSPAIVIDDTPGKTSFTRGVPTSVTVDVANWGAGGLTAPVQVRIWWADPTLAFTTANPFGQAVLLAPAGGGPVRSRKIVGTIPTSAPPHVCLLVHVAAPMDSSPVGSVPDPAGDRHWALLNLTVTVTNSDGVFELSLNVGNPFDQDMVVHLQVGAMDEREVVQLQRRLNRDIRPAQLLQVEMRLADEFTEGVVNIRAGQQLPLKVLGRIPNVSRGDTVAVTVTQMGNPEGSETPLRGAVGVLVTSSEQ